MTDDPEGRFYETEVLRPFERPKRCANGADDEPPFADDESAAAGSRDKKARAIRFVLRRFKDVKVDTSPDYLVKSLLSSTGLAVVWGPPKEGKSFWVFDLLMHVAIGREYRGHRVRQGPVVYCALEGQKGFEKRMEAWRMENLSDAPSADPPFFLMPTALSLVQDVKALIADIRTQLGETKPVAICLDTLNRSITGSESKDEDMGNYIRAADALGQAFKCLVIIVHHCGWEGSRVRGHSSIVGAVEILIAVRKDGDGNVLAELELTKDFEAGLKFLSQLKRVEIGRDEDGDPITSCVVHPIDAAACSTKGKNWSKSLSVFKRALEEALLSAGRSSRPMAEMPEVRAVDQEVVRAEFHRLYVVDSSGSTATKAKNAAFVRCAHDAINRDLMRSRNVGPDLGQTLFWIP